MQFASNLNLNQNELQNVVIQNLTVAPANPKIGQVFFNTVNLKFGFWNGTAWQYGASLVFQNTGPVTWTNVNDTVTLAIAPVSSTLSGLMLAADKTKLDAATTANTFSTIVYRDGTGNIAVSTINATKVTGLNDPTGDLDAVNKRYVDAVAQGLQPKKSVRVGTTTNITLSGLQAIDGVTVVANDRVLVKNQATASQNGVWLANAAAWTRSTDYALGISAKSTFMFIEEGVTQSDSGWTCINDNGSDIVGTANLAYTQTTGAGQIIAGTGMTKTGNQLDINAGDASIVMSADSFRVGVDNLTLEVITGVGVRVKANSINAAHIQTAALGAGLGGGNGTPIFVQGHTFVVGSTLARKMTILGNIGGGVATTFTHGLNTQDVDVLIKDAATHEPFIIDWLPNTPNTITVTANGSTRAVKAIILG